MRRTPKLPPPTDAPASGCPRKIFLALLSGILLGASFPPVGTGVTAFVAFIPLLFLFDELKRAGSVFRYSYLAFLVFNIATIWWVGGWWGDDPWLKAAGIAVNLVHPLWFSLPALAYHLLRRRLGRRAALWMLPFVWTAYEYLAHLPELSFPWLLLGNSQTHEIWKIQFIRYTGVFGISFWIVAVNAALFVLARRLIFGKTRRLMAAPLAAAIVLLVIPEVDGRLELNAPDSGEKLRIGIAQPNMDPYEKWGAGESPMSKLANLASLYDSLAMEKPPALVLWPETAVPFYLLQPSHSGEWQWLRRKIDSVGIPLITGFPDLKWYENSAPVSARKLPDEDVWYQSFNSAMLRRPGGDPQIYHKSRLTPMSERIPYLDALPFLQDALTWGVGISNWGLGRDTTVFRLVDHPRIDTWAMICYETLYPSFVAGFARRGADFFCVITNDGWFGNSSGPYQLKQYAVLRAIENRRAVARCANNGVSCFIDPYGRVSEETVFETRTAIAADVTLRRDQTFYTRHGDVFALACSLAAVAILVYAPFHRRRKK